MAKGPRPLGAARSRHRRFAELRRALPGVSEKMLT